VIEALNALAMLDKDKEDDVVAGKKAAPCLGVRPVQTGGRRRQGRRNQAGPLDTENKSWDKDLAMQLFKTTRAGGLAYEKTIKDYAEKNRRRPR